MKKTFLVTITFFLVLSIFSQNPKNVKSLNSMPIIEKGTEYHDNEEYEKAIQQYKKIPLGDSLYALAQYEIALTYFYQELYPEALKILEYLVENPSPYVRSSSIYTVLGNVYMASNQEEKAVAILDKAIYLSPYSFRLHITQGDAYMKLNQLDKAEKAFEEAIFCAPASQGAHRRLGEVYYKQKRIVPAILALNYAIFLDPKSNQAIDILKYVNQILADISESVESEVNIEELSEELKKEFERFNELKILVESQIALKESYKTKSKVNHIIVYQSQLVFDNLPEPSDSKDIVEFLYIPFFKGIMENKYFNTYAYHIFSGTDLDNGKVEKKAKKMEKQIQKMVVYGIDMLKEKIRFGIGKESNSNPINEYEYDYEKGDINAIGGYTKKNSAGKFIYNGNWITIDNNGSVESNLNLKNGKKDGINTFYKQGYKMQSVPFKMDSIDGVAFVYYQSEFGETEKIKFEVPFVNNKIEGVRKEYHISGIITEEGNYKNDLYNGEVKTYTKHGLPLSKANYVDGELQGLYQDFYPDGKISIEVMYGKKDEEGYLKSYFADGKPKKEATVINNQIVGAFKEYYPNGKIRLIGSFNNGGLEDGFWTEYYENGNIFSEFSYENGELQGEFKMYTRDGFQFGSQIFKKGKLIEIITYLPNKEVRERIPFKNKTVNVTFYNVLGQKISNLNLNEKGNKEGINEYYYPSGNIESFANYKENKLDGVYKSFYNNGKLKEFSNYKNGEQDGLYLEFFENDTLKVEGYSSKGVQIGSWFFYNYRGDLIAQYVYDNGEETYQVLYFPNGEKRSEYFYRNSLLSKEITYNNKKEIIAIDKFVDGSGVKKEYYLNGNIKSKANIRGNEIIDTLYFYDFNGNLKDMDTYLNGQLHGPSKVYSENNNSILAQANYLHGNIHGKHTRYYNNGVIEYQRNFEFGTESGESQGFFYNGKLSRTHSMEMNKREDISTYYAIDGKTQTYKLKYQDDEIIAYAYMTKNNKFSEFIPISKDTQTVVSYYPNGQKSIEFKLLNGDRIEYEILYYPNGKKFRETGYLSNQYHGQYTEYYSNGNIRVTYNNYYDNMNGSYLEYYENGKVSIEGNYYYELPHGVFNYYDINGNLIKVIEFYYGSIINQK